MATNQEYDPILVTILTATKSISLKSTLTFISPRRTIGATFAFITYRSGDDPYHGAVAAGDFAVPFRIRDERRFADDCTPAASVGFVLPRWFMLSGAVLRPSMLLPGSRLLPRRRVP
jgi:hypothetical protein